MMEVFFDQFVAKSQFLAWLYKPITDLKISNGVNTA